MFLRDFAFCIAAPKGHKSSAQGIALGNMIINALSPEGAKLGFEMSFALSGLKFKKTLSQGAALG
jgi:hypothetical protein